MTTFTFAVTGMHCGSCGMLIDETLEELPGVLRAQTTLRTGRTIVHAEPTVSPEAMIAGIRAAGYDATLEQS